MTAFISQRGAVEPFHAMDVLAQANRLRGQGRDIVSMAVGQPGDPAPEAVRQAAAQALAQGSIGYTDALGIQELRQAIARHYADHYGLDVPVERIAVTTGSSAGFNLAFLAMFEAGDRVAITVPGYPAYRNIMQALGLDVVEIGHPGEGHLTAKRLLAEHAQTPLKGVLFASPANPTGAIIPANDLRDLVEAAEANGIAVISDEIYHRLNYVSPDVSALSFGQDAVIINSFSKYYCMTGWRIGWMVLPHWLVRQVERLQQSLYISAPELSQRAAVAAFSADAELSAVRGRYEANRMLLMDRLPRLGLPLDAPMDGAFYAYCDVSAHSNDSMEFARAMLDKAGVAATPGRDFDPVDGGRYMRFSYAGAPREIETALARLEGWLKA
ncbi:MAG: pyridoxal phosphate-dependent aminotransferase [Rhizobiaceae bacterium]